MQRSEGSDAEEVGGNLGLLFIPALLGSGR